MEGIIGVFIPIIMLVAAAIVAIYYIVSKSNERKMLIEKGLSGEDLKEFLGKKEATRNPSSIAKWAIILIGVGLALLIGSSSFIGYAVREQVTFGMVLLFPGVGLLIYYLFIAKKEKDNDNNE